MPWGCWDPRVNWRFPKILGASEVGWRWNWRLGAVGCGHDPGPLWLCWTAGQVVRRLCASTEDCEVDPSKCPASDLPQHQSRLRNSCKEVFENIIHSYK